VEAEAAQWGGGLSAGLRRCCCLSTLVLLLLTAAALIYAACLPAFLWLLWLLWRSAQEHESALFLSYFKQHCRIDAHTEYHQYLEYSNRLRLLSEPLQC
jgi:hypothetical protein